MPLKPLYYTFGNHMHWVDMQWLWGYEVLPGCVADMRNLIEHTGARGCVNFDAIGYEKMAAESPEALAGLRAMIEAGDVEPVGCSYGQPYGLFQPGESNIRQFTYGVRSTRRLLGVRPQTFWEEEFYFFPQLPQMLRRCGYTGANLFFQWTWHTPELPKENASLILWEGIDGSRIPALPRNALNVHQWPEDFDGLLEQGLITELDHPAIVQWLELMPSKDWMCRSEVLLPRLKELMNDARFDVRPRTSAQLIAELLEAHGVASTSPDREGGVSSDTSLALRARSPERSDEQDVAGIPVRYYAPDDVWHGMTLGKNADRHPRTSRRVERQILAAESISALTGLLGRPYPSWDVYPTWEIDEAWRELLAAQHHDNHECEGLCGFVGYQQMAKAEMAANEVAGRTLAHIEDRARARVEVNPLGWTRHVELVRADEDGNPMKSVCKIPPFGFTSGAEESVDLPLAKLTEHDDYVTFARREVEVDLDLDIGVIRQIRTSSQPQGVLHPEQPLLQLRQTAGGQAWSTPRVESVDFNEAMGELRLWLADDEQCAELDDARNEFAGGGAMISIRLDVSGEAIEIRLSGMDYWARPDAGTLASLRMPVVPSFEPTIIRTDSAYAVHEVRGSGRVSRKYPTGDWMTSPQRFEHEEGAICSHSLIDLVAADGSGLLVVHSGSQQWFRREEGVEVVLNAYDPWDERRYEPDLSDPCLRLIPHNGLRDVDRVRLANELLIDEAFEWMHAREGQRTTHGRPVGGGGAPEDHPIPPVFAPIDIAGDDNILCHALYRDSLKSGEHLPDWAGHEMARRSDGKCTHPYVVRLVEWDAEPGTAILKFPGEIACAAKTNLMGEVGPHVGGGEDTAWLEPEPCEPPEWAVGIEIPAGWNQVRVPMKPREIATVMLDLVLGRKQWRDLDAKREVWAKIHKTGEEKKR